MQSTFSRRITRPLVALAALATAAALSLSASPAHAVTWTIEYDAQGTSNIAKTGSNVNLGPTKLTADIDSNGGPITGSMPLPGTRTEFKLIGFIPVTADVHFEVAEPLRGQLTRVGRQRTLESTASYYIRLSNIKVSIFPTFAGPNCRTVNPVDINVATPDGEFFDVMAGGRLTGEYTIGDFQNCGLNTGLINSLIPGGGNTVDLQVSNGQRIA